MSSLLIIRKDASERLNKQITLLQNFLFLFKRKLKLEFSFLVIITILASPLFFTRLMPIVLILLSIAISHNLYSVYRYYNSQKSINEVVNETATFQLIIQKGRVNRPEELKEAYNNFVVGFKAHNPNLSSLTILEVM